MPQLRETLKSFYVNRLLESPTAWRYGLNARRTVEFVRRPAELRDEAKRVLADLDRDGAARSTLEDLTGDSGLLERLQTESKRLEALRTDELERRQRELADKDLGNGYEKSYVVTMLDHDRPVIEPDGVLARSVLSDQLKGIADHYYGLRSSVSDINIWRNLPTGKPAVASQLWHRDMRDDHLILKMFVYLEDVVEGAGPFSYVKGTHGKGDRKWGPKSVFDGMNWRASDEDMEAVTPVEKRPVFTGKAGTVLFADTIGWHRGGHAITQSRLVMQVLFSTAATLPGRALGAPEGFSTMVVPKDLSYDLKTVA